MDVPPSLARHQRDVEAFLRLLLDRPSAPLLYSMARYHLGWEDQRGDPSDAGGKGLRAGLCLLACEASGGDWQAAIPAAGAVELVHSFSLVHDDIQDRDRERHHRPTVWTVWGEAQAINAGDALLALARLALDDFARLGGSPDTAVRMSRCLDEATLEMVEGQVLDLEFETLNNVGLGGYIDMVSRKTGALFGCALGLGALAAAAEPAVSGVLTSLGRTLGVAFQIRDDILGTWGHQAATGKLTGADILRRKKSLPVVWATELAKGEEAIRLREALSEGDVPRVLAAFERLSVRAKCEELAIETADGGIKLLDSITLAPDTGAELREVARFLLERDF